MGYPAFCAAGSADQDFRWRAGGVGEKFDKGVLGCGGEEDCGGGGDGTATVWESATGKMLHKLPGHKGTVNDVRISPDGSLSMCILPCVTRSIVLTWTHSSLGEHGQNYVAWGAAKMTKECEPSRKVT